MSHVDYLCPRCDARVGTARVGAYADPLDPVQCHNCGLRLKFFDLLPRKESKLLKGTTPRPSPLTFLGVVGDTVGTSPLVTQVFSVGQSLMLVMTAGNIDSISWGTQTGVAISPESDAGISFYLFNGPGSFPLVMNTSGPDNVIVVSEIPGGIADPFQGPDAGPRFNVGSVKEVTVDATSHFSNTVMVGSVVSGPTFPLIFSDPPTILGPTVTVISGTMSSFYAIIPNPVTQEASVYMQGGSPWQAGLTVIRLP